MSINCIYGCNILILFTLFLLLLVYIIQYSIFNKYTLEDCNIHNIIYPKNLNYNSDGYISCNKFNETYQTCISLYGNIRNIRNNKTKIIQNNISQIIDKDCTFRNSNCINNFTYQIINSTINKALKYEEIYIMNKTIKCWTDKENNNLYLYNYNYVDIKVFIIISSLIFTILLDV